MDRYRVDRSVGRILYRQAGAEASEADQVLGMLDDARLTARVAALLNADELLHAGLLAAESWCVRVVGYNPAVRSSEAVYGPFPSGPSTIDWLAERRGAGALTPVTWAPQIQPLWPPAAATSAPGPTG